MASLLGMDWTNSGLYIVAGRGNGSKLMVEQALLLPQPFRADPNFAATVGQQLKPLLKQAGINSTTTYACVGREHLVCRDIRYPDVPAHEVPAIAQFQVSKELTLPIEQTVTDFAPVSVPWPSGEKRALGMVLRKDVLGVFIRLCAEAGLNLAGLTARAFALQANWAGLPRTATAETVGLLAGNEFTVTRHNEVLFSRHFDDATPLPQELRRSLAAYSNQYPQQPIQEMYLADAGTPPEFEALRSAVRVPIHLYNSWSAVRSTLGPQEDVRFAGACGALKLGSQGTRLPLDFYAPKKGEPPPNKSREYARIGVLVAILFVLLLGGGYMYFTSSLDADLEEVQGQITKLNSQLKDMGEVNQQLIAINEWSEKEMVILDEIYDLIAVFPDAAGLQITRAHWSPATQTAGPTPRSGVSTIPIPGAAKNIKPIGQLTLEILGDSPEVLEQLRRAIDNVSHWDMDQWRRDPQDPKKVTALVRVYPQKPHEYRNTLGDPTHRTNTVQPTSTGPRRPTFRGGRP